MNHRFLLYIDILGFSELVAHDVSRIDDLYEVLASLNAHNHYAFKCVIFSDTMLVYNIEGGNIRDDISYILMFMCEFARDLLHRLTNRGIYFRAVITHGNFRHYELNSIPCFFGTALINAYLTEKKIKAIGLFLDHSLSGYCDIFPTQTFNSEFDFVYITQALDSLETLSGGNFPFDAWYLEETDLIYMVTPELLHLVDLYRHSTGELSDDVKRKYKTTVRLYEHRYPGITEYLKASDMNITALSPNADWQEVLSRHPESMAWAIKTRKEF